MLMILLHCCSIFFTKTITSITIKLLSYLKEPTELSQRNPHFFQGYVSGSTLQVVTCWRKNTVLINHIFHVI